MPTIFLHSSFRTSSTWLWSRFRRIDRVVAFNEFFNEQLARVTRHEAVTRGPEAWHSKHPPGAAYYLEFLPFIREEGGVRGYDRSMNLDRFIPAAGIGGAISPEERAYVGSLIEGAERLGKVPVLSCTRTLGRLAGLKDAFPGLHVLLHRNIFHQWCSYGEQLDRGNSFFSRTLRSTIARNQHDPYLRMLQELLPLEDPPTDGVDTFFAFVLLHLHLYAHSVGAADLLVDAGQLCRERAYGRAIEAAFAERADLVVDLSDATASLGYTFADISAKPGARATLRGLAAPIILDAPSAVGKQFAEQALAACIEEAERYAFYAGTLARRVVQTRGPVSAPEEQPVAEAPKPGPDGPRSAPTSSEMTPPARAAFDAGVPVKPAAARRSKPRAPKKPRPSS